MTLVTVLMSPHSNKLAQMETTACTQHRKAWECEHRLDLCVPTADGKGQVINWTIH